MIAKHYLIAWAILMTGIAGYYYWQSCHVKPNGWKIEGNENNAKWLVNTDSVDIRNSRIILCKSDTFPSHKCGNRQCPDSETVAMCMQHQRESLIIKKHGWKLPKTKKS